MFGLPAKSALLVTKASVTTLISFRIIIFTGPITKVRYISVVDTENVMKVQILFMTIQITSKY
jgi:hypothetical protein